jgi:hypothetical protein
MKEVDSLPSQEFYPISHSLILLQRELMPQRKFKVKHGDAPEEKSFP